MPRDPLRALLDSPPDLPVTAVLADVVDAVRSRGVVVVQAPPGTGKTTLVPPALAASLPGRLVLTQPRRVAARAAARRLAHLLGEPVGLTVGYSVRGESRTGPDTRIEVVTTGVLLARLRHDPELAGVGAVVLDEIHERHLDADLALALLLDVRATLRPDLALVAMSATVEATRTADALSSGGVPAPIVEVGPVAMFPVETRWRPAPAAVARLDARGTTPAFWDHVASVTREAVHAGLGDVLVFVPGAREVDLVVRTLRASTLAGENVDVHPLHGRLPAREQDVALDVGPRRRVVVTTAVAESSLTVPGVRVVVDAGLSREPRTDHRRGLAGLVTVGVSRASAEQRAGRAGRQGPGLVLRCWSEVDHARLLAHPLPEIRTADLTAFCLELACWGAPDGKGLTLLDQPPAHALASAHAVLHALGAIDAAGAATQRGRAIVRTGTDPRLGRALLDGAPLVGLARAAEIVALLSEDVRAPGADLVAAWRRLRSTRGGDGDARQWRAQVARLERTARSAHRAPSASVPGHGGLGDDDAAGVVVALAYPDRVARRRPGSDVYLMVQGTGATLPPASPLLGAPWLAVADADRGAGRRDAVIRAAAPLAEELALEAALAELADEDEVTWRDGRVVARRRTRLGAIVLTDEGWRDPPAHRVVEAVREALATDGLGVLPWRAGALALRARLALLNRTLGDPWPLVSDEALTADLDRWLGPDLGRVRTAADLARLDVATALRRLLPWPQAGRLAELVPERVDLPTGTSAAVDYGDGDAAPVLSARVQELFGWAATPRLVDGRVPVVVHLLSPARRPVAITSDLASFWSGPYRDVRAEMRGRYPKHDWPEDPTTAAPSRGPRPRPR